jgi:SMC interacting uncharacterized protein involved in chromosome segregation
MFENTRTARDKVYPSLRAKKWVRIERIDIEPYKGAECVAITKKGKDIAIKRLNEIGNGFSKEAPQIQQRLVYQDDRMLDENLRKELCQNHGLNWLSSNYFESHKSIENDFDNWKKGFSFDLPSIKAKREPRREGI